MNNPDPSTRENTIEGRNADPKNLAQAIVADREFITSISAAILENIAPQLARHTGNIVSATSVGFSAQSDKDKPVVSYDQSGMAQTANSVVSVDQTDAINTTNPVTSDDQTGRMSNKRHPETVIDVESYTPGSKRARSDSATEGNSSIENPDIDPNEGDIFSSNSRWEASEELAAFLTTTTSKPLSKFDQRTLVKAFPRPDVSAIYTPSMDEYLKSFVQGITIPDKPLREMQDHILDVFGPLSTIYENLLEMAESCNKDGVIELNKESVQGFLTCIKHAMLLTGDASARISVVPKMPQLSLIQERVLDQEVQELLTKEAVHPVVNQSLANEGFISSLFVVSKKDGGNRPVINLKQLNQHLIYEHFKMEGIHMLRDLLKRDDYLIKIDLKDAYLTVPICKAHQKFLRFLWKGTLLEFACLPFGLATAPRVFTKLMKPVVAALRQRGIRLVIYLDDILIMAESTALGLHQAASALNLLEGLGFVVNYKKSQLVPGQLIEFLGFLIDSTKLTLQLPREKLRKIRKKCQTLLSGTEISVRELSKFLGLLTSSIQAIFPAPLHYKHLQRLKNTTMSSTQSYEAIVTLDTTAREEVVWWRDHLQAWNGKALFQQPVDLVIETDASRKGWGAYCEGVSTGGPWCSEEKRLHINCLELLAGSFAIVEPGRWDEIARRQLTDMFNGVDFNIDISDMFNEDY
ncbi:uncharacterized protein LOC114534197 [Dendronephthya gigantea]|uniref:uncharacterized protein LOC114534197 n=1 Tax=Dendronephthya gigantea TaxID=151771 RepID=UPI00106D9748|nr:uncharacterized protein LOC114534197 [Dendronephthya gigantea]